MATMTERFIVHAAPRLHCFVAEKTLCHHFNKQQIDRKYDIRKGLKFGCSKEVAELLICRISVH